MRGFRASRSAYSRNLLTPNTDELTITIGVVYGPDGAAAFDQLWTNHIEFFNDYAAARGASDDDAAAEATASLGHYESDFSSYIDTATSGEADFHDVLHMLHSHVAQLLEQADAWADGDYPLAMKLGVEAHQHMDAIANALATGIALQQPRVFTGDPAHPIAISCAAKQLDGSTLISLLGSLAEAERTNDSAAVTAAESVVVELRALTDPHVVLVVDQVAPPGSDAMATPSARAAARDAVRGLIAQGPCADSVVGA